MIYVLLACLLVALLIYPSQIKRQVHADYHARAATLTKMQAIPRVQPRTNGVTSSHTYYQPSPKTGEHQAQG